MSNFKLKHLSLWGTFTYPHPLWFKLLIQSKLITTDVVSSNPARARFTQYNISDKVCQWLVSCRWFSPGTPLSSTINIINWPPQYNWNIVESGVKHHNHFIFFSCPHPAVHHSERQGYQEILRWNLCVRKNHSGTINKLKKELVGRNPCFCLLLPVSVTREKKIWMYLPIVYIKDRGTPWRWICHKVIHENTMFSSHTFKSRAIIFVIVQ
jgi:hypothetical protein